MKTRKITAMATTCVSNNRALTARLPIAYAADIRSRFHMARPHAAYLIPPSAGAALSVGDVLRQAQDERHWAKP